MPKRIFMTPPAGSARDDAGRFERFYAVVRLIPRGRVTTYGHIAVLAGLPGRARLVGTALGALHPKTTVPWHRVINAGGRISKREEMYGPSQRSLLEKEGVAFSRAGVVSFERFGWHGARAAVERRLRRR